MTSLPFDTTGLTSAGVDLFINTYNLLKQKFNIQVTGIIDFHLEDFEAFRQYQNVILHGSFAIKDAKTDCYILFIEKKSDGYSAKGGAYSYSEYQTWALAYLKHDFGRLLIRKETLADKIIELVHPVEIDFKEDKAFSDTFYVVANDRTKAILGINREFRDSIMNVRHDDFTIEIFDYTLIIGDSEPMNAEKAIHLAGFVTRLCSTC